MSAALVRRLGSRRCGQKFMEEAVPVALAATKELLGVERAIT
jgi:phosphoribosyl-ATP pyrophosphohydrolase